MTASASATMSGKAKQNRDELELQFMGVRRSLLHVCEATPVVKRGVSRKVAELEEIWVKLIKSHSLYCKSAGIGISSAESSEYIDQKARREVIHWKEAEEVSGAVDSRGGICLAYSDRFHD